MSEDLAAESLLVDEEGAVAGGRLRGAIWGQLVGDAFCLGSHWIYDLDDLAKAFPEGVHGFETPQPGHYHYGKYPGDQTHYGDAALVMLESVAALGRFDAVDFGRRFVALFGSPDYRGYRDHSTSGTLENAAAFALAHPGTPFDFQSGADDDQLATASRLAPVIAAHWRQGEATLIEMVERATRVTQDDARAVAYMKANAMVLARLFGGSDLLAAVRAAEEGIVAADPANGPEVREKIRAAIEAVPEGTIEAILAFGQSCPLEHSFPSALQCALKYAHSFREAMLANARAGGDNAGRAAMLGAWLGASLGLAGIPVEWRQRLAAADRIDRLIDQLSGKMPPP